MRIRKNDDTRIITTNKPKKEIVKIMKGVGIKDYSLRKLSGRNIRITLKSNMETLRKILERLGE